MSPASMPRLRLPTMMFLEYVALGATLPILSLYLRQHLGFSGTQVGVIAAMSAVAALVTPLITAFVAERWLSTERLLALCHLIAAGLVFALWTQSSFLMVALLYLLYMLALRPTIALSNAAAFHHLPADRAAFASIRVWGTIGWIAVSWAFSLWLHGAGQQSRLPHALLVASAASLVMFVHAWTLPRGAPGERQRPTLVPSEALALFRRHDIALLSVVNVLVFVTHQYYYLGTAPFLKQVGFAESTIMPAMSLGQLTEVVAMFTLGAVMRRVPIRGVLAFGILSDVVRFGCFALGSSTPLILLGIAGHGPAIAMWMMASLIHLDRQASPASRSSAQLLFMMVTFGGAALTGSLLAGWTMDRAATTDGLVNYQLYWSVPLGIALLALLTLALLFPRVPLPKQLHKVA